MSLAHFVVYKQRTEAMDTHGAQVVQLQFCSPPRGQERGQPVPPCSLILCLLRCGELQGYARLVSGQILHFHVIRLPWNKFFEQSWSTAQKKKGTDSFQVLYANIWHWMQWRIVYLRVVVGTMGGLQPKIIDHRNLLLQISKGVMAWRWLNWAFDIIFSLST